MSVLVIIDLKAKPGSVDELSSLLNLAQARAHAGNQGVELTVSQDDPNHVVLAEHWESREAYEAFRAQLEESGEWQTLVALLDGIEGLNVRVFDIVETARAKRSKTRDEALEDLEEWSKRWLTLRAEIRSLADQRLSAEHLGPVIKLHNEELDSIMSELAGAD